jgi:DNA-binding transcriptional LysR family regulator
MAGAENKWVRIDRGAAEHGNMRRKIALADLVDGPWLLPPSDSIIGASILEAFSASGLKPPRGHVVSFSIPLCCQLLAGERFLAMLPLSMASVAKGGALKVLDVEFAGIPRPTGIFTLKRRTPTSFGTTLH